MPVFTAHAFENSIPLTLSTDISLCCAAGPLLSLSKAVVHRFIIFVFRAMNSADQRAVRKNITLVDLPVSSSPQSCLKVQKGSLGSFIPLKVPRPVEMKRAYSQAPSCPRLGAKTGFGQQCIPIVSLLCCSSMQCNVGLSAKSCSR